jgi:uncharacterized protein DUF4395
VSTESASGAERNFVTQQGFDACDSDSRRLASALMVQPHGVGLWAFVGAATQAVPVFASLALVLWWSALVPRANPFDALYNRLIADRRGGPLVPPAPAPRRFSQAMAGMFAGAIALCLAAGALRAALILEVLFFALIAALIFGRFCLGAFAYHAFRGRLPFALRTLPWGRGV